MRSLFFIALLACTAIAVSANTCGGNCPSNDCPGCPCGTSTAYVDIASSCAGYGGWIQSQCQCIVSHESSGNSHAANYNPGGGTYDIGVWQVNTINWSSCSGGNPPCGESTNLGCAIDVWRWGGGTFKLWSTCGGCGACSSEENTIDPSWDGTWPSWYDASRPFPSWALNSSDTRIAESLNYQMPKPIPQPIILTEQ